MKKAEANPKTITFAFIAFAFLLTGFVSLVTQTSQSYDIEPSTDFDTLNEMVSENSELQGEFYLISHSQDSPNVEINTEEEKSYLREKWPWYDEKITQLNQFLTSGKQYATETFENSMYYKAFKSVKLVANSVKLGSEYIGSFGKIIPYGENTAWIAHLVSTLLLAGFVWSLVYFVRSGK